MAMRIIAKNGYSIQDVATDQSRDEWHRISTWVVNDAGEWVICLHPNLPRTADVPHREGRVVGLKTVLSEVVQCSSIGRRLGEVLDHQIMRDCPLIADALILDFKVFSGCQLIIVDRDVVTPVLEEA